MDETVLKVAIAAFCHDIGKFADADVLGVNFKNLDEYDKQHYLPSYNGRYSHFHALYTAEFFKKFAEFLPGELTRPDWGDGDYFSNISARHHTPGTAMEWVVAIADRVGSGWDRDKFESDYNHQVAIKDYKKTRLIPLFEQIDTQKDKINDSSSDYKYRYKLDEITPKNIFPILKEKASPEKNETAKSEYKNLFDKFVKELTGLPFKDENVALWFENFESLVMKMTSAIPAARVGNVVHDVSLYDHLKTTAALAAAIYLYHHQNDSLTIDAVKNYEDDKFLLINGDFKGIQNFIFGKFTESAKSRSKILRGRSFAVSLLSELAADLLCKKIGVPFTSIILNAAGKFTIIAPNTQQTTDAVEKVKDKINKWLIKTSFGETIINISSVPACCNDFTSGKFIKLWDNFIEKMDEARYSDFDSDKFCGVVDGYLNSFNNKLNSPLCPLCGKRPSDKETEIEGPSGEVQSQCRLCRDHIYLGTNIVKKNKIAIVSRDAVINSRDKLLEPIFGEYQVCFSLDNSLDLAQKGQLIKYWNIDCESTDYENNGIAVKYINGYVPKYSKEHEADSRLLTGRKDENKMLEDYEMIKVGEPVTFNHIAKLAINNFDGKDKGLEALAVLKADVDNLGIIMSCGLSESRFTLSRLSTISRQLSYYFSVYLPWYLKNNKEFNEIYTVFAGGDDLFLIGPWNRIIDLSIELSKSFADYVCHNSEIHFSAGISLHKPHTTVDTMAESSEHELEKSKEGAKNKLTLFSETVEWHEMEKFELVMKTLKQWLDDEWISRVMFYRLNEFINMAAEEKRIVKDNEISMADMHCTKWRSLLVYSTERNIGKKVKKDIRAEVVAEVAGTLSGWLAEYGSKLRIPVWSILYNCR